MIGPQMKDLPPHPRSLLKRKQPPVDAPSAAKRSTPDSSPTPATSPTEIVDIVSDVCNYETISDYIQLFGEECEETEVAQGSPASLESGYYTSGPQDVDDEDSNLSWLLNFKVSSLFDPADDNRLPKKEDTCKCSCAVYQKPAGKPPYTYTELIEKALKEQGELTVSGIYSWISSKFPYYSPSDDRWKNSVRHNLSINPHFRKGVKSRHGAGHLWTLSNEGVSPPPDSWVRRPTLTNLHAVAHNISRHKRLWKRRNLVMEDTVQRSQGREMEGMDEAAIAAASIIESPVESAEEPGTPLTRVAEQILSGVKRRVEVQYLVHDHNTNEFLNPVSKEDIVSESGLDTAHCEAASSLLSDLNTELHLPDNLFSDELAFTCYPQL